MELEPISIADSPLAGADGAVRIVSEVPYPNGRLIAYVKEGACGIFATSAQDSNEEKIDLASEWPRGDEGSNTNPAGPYNKVSGAGGPKTWASMLCGKSAMVIEYATGQAGAPGPGRGHTTVAQLPGRPATSRIIVGAPDIRDRIQQRPTH
ncbi:hypothetical protein ABZ891_13115 [Streptomyces sp. NPDC047023]|uniref:hypothetical protein n=1 Tax=Streptomyces sp. NPDC047023 TaxID=3155139 RepID=UPI0033DC9F75